MAEAEVLMRRVLAIREKVLMTDHPGIFRSMEALAELLDATNRSEEAGSLRKRALESRYNGHGGSVC